MTKIDILDHGFAQLVDIMGNDMAIVEAARVSYDPQSTTATSDDRGLIRYLYRHKHTTPFEMVEFKFHLKMPIFVARQWIRHRTANINEVSGRYSVMKDEFHVPNTMRLQSSSNKQGSGANADANLSESFINLLREEGEQTFQNYQTMVDWGVAREQARINLPLSTYTEFYWKIDLHNLLHFLKLRTDPHAQLEIRIFADALETHVKAACPLAHEAWVDFSKEAHTFSKQEMKALSDIILDSDVDLHDYRHGGMSNREWDAFVTTLIGD